MGVIQERDLTSGPEYAYILAILRKIVDPNAPLPDKSELDWVRFYELLRRHGLSNLFYVWGKTNPSWWPPETDLKLGQDRYQALFFGDRFAEHVKRMLEALKAAGMDVIVLKGWALIQSIYEQDYSRRAYADIDILVRPQDAARAETLLAALGYQPQTSEPWPGHIRRFRNGRAYLSAEPLDPFPRKFMVGLHWGLLDTPYFQRRMDMNQLFDDAHPLRVTGVKVLEIDLADHLVYAWGHLALHHEYDPMLQRYYEFAWLICNHPDLDWERICQRAVDWHLVLPAQITMAKIERTFPGSIPPKARKKIAELQATRSEKFIHRQVVEYRANHWLRALLAWLSMPGILHRLRFWVETTFPSPAYMRERYGDESDWPWPFLYLLRYWHGLTQAFKVLE